MPRTIFDKYAAPPKDPVKAQILDRINALHLSAAEGSKIMGVSESTYLRRLNHQHTDEWPLGIIKRMYRGLKLVPEDLKGAVTL